MDSRIPLKLYITAILSYTLKPHFPPYRSLTSGSRTSSASSSLYARTYPLWRFTRLMPAVYWAAVREQSITPALSVSYLYPSADGKRFLFISMSMYAVSLPSLFATSLYGNVRSPDRVKKFTPKIRQAGGRDVNAETGGHNLNFECLKISVPVLEVPHRFRKPHERRRITLLPFGRNRVCMIVYLQLDHSTE